MTDPKNLIELTSMQRQERATLKRFLEQIALLEKRAGDVRERLQRLDILKVKILQGRSGK
mgnify:FL=1